MTNSLSYVPYLMGGLDRGARVDVMGGLDRGLRVDVMGGPDRGLRVDVMGGLDRGPRVDVMGGLDRGPRVDVMGGHDPVRYPQAVRDGAPRSVEFRFRSAKRGSVQRNAIPGAR